MKILLVAATYPEIAPFLKDLGVETEPPVFSGYTYKNNQLDVLITGIGIAHTSFYLGKYLLPGYNLCINVGICGSFNYTIKKGEVVNVTEDCFAELGAEDDENFLSVEELRLPGTYSLINENQYTHTLIQELLSVKGVTVSTSHGNQKTIKKFLARTKADVESMEGAAFLWACNQAGVTCVQLRSVSNYVEKRDRSKWDIPSAISSLNFVLRQVL